MSDEECDYMSDAFLITNPADDIRPGLIHDRTVRREIEQIKKKEAARQTNSKTTKVLENENLINGLDTPISSQNKGFAMLTKMGFNPGSGLGLKGQGRSEPLKIELKNDKQGLGRVAEIKELMEIKRKRWEEAKQNAPAYSDYRAGLSAKASIRILTRDFEKSQKACHMLDTKEGFVKPDEEWFWPKRFVQSSEGSSESDESDNEEPTGFHLSTEDKLELLTIYLRRSYFYCIWCGVQYNDEGDLKKYCPGQTRDEH